MRTRRSMKETHENIRAALKEMIETHDALAEVKEVTYGRKAGLRNFRTPSVWILPTPHAPTQMQGNTQQHDITFNLVVLVRAKDPEEGYEKAQDLTLQLYDALEEDRTLNGTCDDVVPQRFDPAFSGGEDNPQLYWGAVEFAFRIRRR